MNRAESEISPSAWRSCSRRALRPVDGEGKLEGALGLALVHASTGTGQRWGGSSSLVLSNQTRHRRGARREEARWWQLGGLRVRNGSAAADLGDAVNGAGAQSGEDGRRGAGSRRRQEAGAWRWLSIPPAARRSRGAARRDRSGECGGSMQGTWCGGAEA